MVVPLLAVSAPVTTAFFFLGFAHVAATDDAMASILDRVADLGERP